MGQGFGKRADGSEKGNGFLGVIQRPDGKVSSEISVGVNIDGKEVEIPTLVPTLTKAERDFLINNDISDPKKIPASIIQKAVDHARPRLAAGKSPFAGPEDTMADPKLEEIVQRMIDAGESEENIGAVISEYKPAAPEKPYTGPPVDGGPEDYWSGFLTSLKPGGSSDQAALKGAKGFVKEAIPGTVKAGLALPGQVIDLVKELYATGVGGVHLLTDPVGTLSAAADKVKEMPAAVQHAFKSAMDLAAQDPEGFGKAAADITAQADVGIAASAAVPMMPKPIANRVGAMAEQIGTKGAWPIRMMGAHQLGSGNPMGILTMSMPEAMKKTGDVLQEFGGADRSKLLPSGTRELDFGDVKSPAIRVMGQTGTQNGPHVPTVGGSVEPSRASVRSDAKAKADTARFQSDIETNLSRTLDSFPNKNAAGIAAVDKNIGTTARDAHAIRIDARRTEAAAVKSEAAADLAHQNARVRSDKAVDRQQERLLEDFQNKKAADKATETINTAKAGMQPGQPKINETVKAPGQTMTTSYAAEGSGLTPMEQELLKRASSVKPVASHRTVDSLAPKTEFRPVASHETPAVSGSKSRRSESPISGMSSNDISAMQDILENNPGISAEEAAAEVVKQRAQRSQGYRDEARLSKLEKSALDREID